jgi:phage host-nuclease inhibitor protein Gam
MSAKKKAPAIDVPQSDAAADAALKEYGEAFNVVARNQADMDDALAKVKATYEAAAKPLQERMNTLFDQLAAWGAAHRTRLTEDTKSKTVKLPSGAIGWRCDPPSVRIRKGLKVDAVIEAIKEHGLRRFLRVKFELNKERMLEEPEYANKIDGVKVAPGEEKFFVEPFGASLAEPKP